MKICVLITMKYPFGKGETFLENEVSFLTSTFDKVIILALSAGVQEQKTRNLPPNVIAVPIGNIKSKFRYIFYSIHGIFSATKEERVEISSASKLIQKASCYYASGRSSVSFSKVCKILEKEIKWGSVDSCVFYSYWFMDQALLAVKLSKYYSSQCKTSSVSRAHGYDLYDSRNRANYNPYRTIIFNLIDGVFPCSLDGVEYLKEKFPEYSDKISVSYLGTLDHGQVDYELNQHLPLQIVTCSNIISLKRVDIVLDAVNDLTKMGISIHWNCIGDGPLLPNLKKRANELDLNDHITFLGRLSNSEVVKFYQTNPIGLFINTSASEGLPVSIMEALSFGIPCLATNVGGTKELVSSTVGELLPDDIDGKGLAVSIKKILELDINNMKQLRKQAREKWETRVFADKNYQKWCKILHSDFI